MKKLAIFLALLFIVMAFAGCAGTTTEPTKGEVTNETETPSDTSNEATPTEKVTVTVGLWDENQKDSIQRTLDTFNASQDAIEAVIELTPWSNYWTKLDASLGAETAPDIFWMNVTIGKYVDGGVVEPLDPFIERDGIDITQYVPGTTGIYHVDGKQWGMPKGMDTIAVALNTEYFERCGAALPESDVWTWQDMETLAQAMIDSGKLAADEAPIAMELDAQPSYYNFINQLGGFVINDDYTEAGFHKAESKQAFTQVIDLMKTGKMHDYTTLTETKGTDLFISGKAAILFVGSWKATVLEECTLGAEGKVKIVEMPINGNNNYCVQGGLSYCMFSASKHKDEAWEVMKYLTGEVGNTHQAEDGIDIPALMSKQQVYADSFNNIDITAWLDAAATAIPYPFGPYATQYGSDITDHVSQVFSENEDISYLDNLNQIMQDIIDAGK